MGTWAGRHQRRKHKHDLELHCLPSKAICTDHTLLKGEDLAWTPCTQKLKQNRKSGDAMLHNGYCSARFRWMQAG